MTGISAMPSCRAASTLAWPAIRPPSSPTSAGLVQPHSLMLAAGDYDDQLHRSHDHRDRRGHRIVVLLEGGGVSGDGDDPRRTSRGAQQYRRREDRESLDEAEAEGDREPRREE